MGLWAKIRGESDTKRESEESEKDNLESAASGFLFDMLTLGVDSGRSRDYFIQLWIVRSQGRTDLDEQIDKAARLIASAQGGRRDLESQIASALRLRLR